MSSAAHSIHFPDCGSKKFVQISMLEDQGFMDRNGEFQLELTLSNIHSTFEHKFKINQSIFAANSAKMSKLETSYFSFGIYDWSLSVYPTGRSDSQLGKNSAISKCGTLVKDAFLQVFLMSRCLIRITNKVSFVRIWVKKRKVAMVKYMRFM